MTNSVDRLSDRMDNVEAEIKDMKKEVARLNGEVVKLNLISSENSRALIKLVDNAERIDRLEKAVLKK